jgi:uncharacterized membrane protein YgcG
MEAFTITGYDVHTTISVNNVFDVTETINVHFTEPRHGIYRNIPFRGQLTRQAPDGTLTYPKYKLAVTDVNVEGFESSTSKSGDDVVIKIGSADTLVEGDQTYKISYKLKYGDDGAPDYDEVYYNITGTGWDTTMDNVTFTVELPKPFDASKLGFSVGSEGSAGYDPEKLKFNVDGNTITGKVIGQLSNYEGVTMRVELPQGYFIVADPRIGEWLVMGFITLLALVSVLLFLKFGRDDKPVKTVEFYAPDGLTPAEIGYINDGCVDNRDVVSLLMYWADKGYLTIEDNGGGDFKLNQVKEMGTEMKNFEQHMFKKLFKDGPTVTTTDLKYTFYTTIASTKSMVSDSFERDDRRVFTKASMGLKPLLSFITALPVLITVALAMYRDSQDLMDTLIPTAIIGGLILLPVFFLIGTMRNWRGDKPTTRMIKLLSSLFLCLIAVVFFLIITYDKVTVSGLPWFAAFATVVLGLTAVFISKRTPKGVEWQGKIIGFKEFIELAERDKLIALVEQNPSYFYNVLPYAYVLNVTDKWAKRFETIALQPPQWYSGYGNVYSPILFVSSLNHSMNSVQSMMVSTPPSKGGGGGGGGFSGGGFSGGGMGGGGGGSW